MTKIELDRWSIEELDMYRQRLLGMGIGELPKWASEEIERIDEVVLARG